MRHGRIRLGIAVPAALVLAGLLLALPSYAKEPDFPEALFLKAQILWEGFDDREGAKNSLMRIIKVEPDEKAVLRRWALNLYRELSEANLPDKGEEIV